MTKNPRNLLGNLSSLIITRLQPGSLKHHPDSFKQPSRISQLDDICCSRVRWGLTCQHLTKSWLQKLPAKSPWCPWPDRNHEADQVPGCIKAQDPPRKTPYPPCCTCPSKSATCSRLNVCLDTEGNLLCGALRTNPPFGKKWCKMDVRDSNKGRSFSLTTRSTEPLASDSGESSRCGRTCSESKGSGERGERAPVLLLSGATWQKSWRMRTEIR